jgi:hypothetical protein
LAFSERRRTTGFLDSTADWLPRIRQGVIQVGDTRKGNNLQLYLEASSGFLREYGKAFIDLQRQIQHSISDLRARFKTLGPSATSEYDLYSSFSEPCRAVGLTAVLEIEVGGGPRMLMGTSGNRLILLDVGNNDSKRRWDSIKNKRSWLRERMSTATPANHFGTTASNQFLSLEPSKGWAPYFHDENSESWMYFLDDQQ